jgi:type I restriction enzyme S subunit
VEWLGEVPEHWNVDRMKWAIEQPKNGIWGNEESGDENDIPCVRVADFDRQGLRVFLDNPTIRNVTRKEREGRVLVKNDLLIEKSGGGELQPVGCVVIYEDDRPAISSNFVAKASARIGMSASYWRYLHSAAYSARINTRSIKQTSGIQNLDQSQYLDESSCYPPLREQERIATFLDHETAKIDALIAEQQRLIELLQEKRQAVISHAVTKGLNPHAPMKDSGVEWLGEVPEHWGLITLGRLCISKCDGPFGSGLKSEHYVEEGVLVVRLQNIKSHGYDDIVSAYIDSDYYKTSLGDHDVIPGDLLIAGLGDENNLVGRACVAPSHLGPAMVKADCFRFRLNRERISPAFASFSLNASSRFHGGILSSGSTRSRIPLSMMASREVALPPIEEQLKIEMHIQNQLGRINALQSESVSAVQLLQERRSALISAAVTGQIDVRGLVPEAVAA